MKKVHISLVGGQPIPVYIGIKNDGQASTIVLVCSPQSHDEAERIKEQFPKRNIEIQECQPTDLLQIEALAVSLKERFEDCEITVNLTGGTKLWSISFYSVFSEMPASKFVYVDQTNLITNLQTKESHYGSIATTTRFELYGTPLTSFTTLDEYSQDDIDNAKAIERIRKVNRNDFRKLTSDFDREKLERNVPIPPTENGSSIEYAYEENWARIIIQGKDKSETKELQSEHLFNILFNSGWFELKTAVELSKNPNVEKIWLNCELADLGGSPKNEIDIIADMGNRLFFIECKTMIFNATDIDKFRSALRNFSGTSSTGVFVTNDMPGFLSGSKYGHAMEKCKDNDILTFNFSLWKKNPSLMPSLNETINSILHVQNKR
jgi:hypothetical protein